jgi:photosystem II stability/assembly factor-like uncharacterized protein
MLTLKRLLICIFLLLIPSAALSQWTSIGPFGGSARTLAFNPSNPDQIFLGSSAGAIFESVDRGSHWRPFAHLGVGDDLMVKCIIIDPMHPNTIYVAGWNVSGDGGGFFLTRDGGQTWIEPASLKGKSIQALALSESDARILIAGAIDGVYRSGDSGETWERISPKGHLNLKNIESVTIDPRDANVIYAGTWHLPWKTIDGGKTWNNIKQGVIDDSDVFSIILEHSTPDTVYASACSGIYKSVNGGKLFHKIQGIPGTARRTRVLQQDPKDEDTVYAGTTEGLWKTTDAGKTFHRITPSDFILNDVLVDTRDSKRVLIATDRGGVFVSDDAGATFSPSNDGFSQRQVSIVIAGKNGDDSLLYAGVLNDKKFGGVFRFVNGTWLQMSDGLDGRDIFDLGISTRGQLVAGTSRGILLLDEKSRTWHASQISGSAPGAKALPFDGRTRAISITPLRWYAATDSGLLHSENDGVTWAGGAIEGEASIFSVSAHDQVVVAASEHKVWMSSDAGQHWSPLALPPDVTHVYSVTVISDGTVLACTREGALRWIPSSGSEGEWAHVLDGLPWMNVTSIREEGNLLLATVGGSPAAYIQRGPGEPWVVTSEPVQDEVTGALVVGETIYLTTQHHGVLAQRNAATVGGLR